MDSRLIKQTTLLVVILGAICAASFFFNPSALGWCALVSAVAALYFISVSVARHREIRRITEQIVHVIDEGRSIDISDYRENDIAILANSLQKASDKMSRLAGLLAQEKNSLASALADITHQIRTPLTAAELMLAKIEREDNAQTRKEQLRQLEILLERISWLVTTLLKIAKADAGTLSLENTQVSAKEAIVRAVEPLALSLDLRDIHIEIDAQGEAFFMGDVRWSAEAIENIVKNAMENSQSGGIISIRASEDAMATRIVIEDSGCGISDVDLPHLFERFYRSSESPSPEGFGIGLSLAQSLVSAQGGTLRAENRTDNSGARFTISFPK